MNYQEFSVAVSAVVQVLDGFVGNFVLNTDGCEVSVDGTNFYASGPIPTSAEVRLPTSYWVRNSTGVTRTPKLATWY